MKKLLIFWILFGFFNSLFAQTDSIPPTLICKQNPVVAYISPVGYLSITVGDTFYDTLYDNVSDHLELGIRKVCMGAGFPQDTQLNYSIWGYFAAEIWARDEAGNTSSCMVNIDIIDGCGCIDPAPLYVLLQTEMALGITDAKVDLRNYHCYYDSTVFIGSISHGSLGITLFPFILEPGSNLSITPYKNENPLNGITTYDLVLISKHILGIEPLGSPYKMIAADANLDGKITTADVVLLRKLLLGINQELPGGKSWRFVPKNYSFPNIQNPFDPPFPETISEPFVPESIPLQFLNFVGMKIGDVNNTAIPGN